MAANSAGGEDVTYDAPDHDALYDDPEAATDGAVAADGDAAADFSDRLGEWTVSGFSDHLDDADLFPRGDPERETARPYRRWAVESAALDLALRQADTDLGTALGRDRDPVRFVASTRLGERSEAGTASDDRAAKSFETASPSRGDGSRKAASDPPRGPSLDRATAISERVPGIEFKLDPTIDWSDAVFEGLPVDRVRILDLKGLYEGTDVDQTPDPAFYERVVTAFPEAVLEDSNLTDETRPILEGEEDRVSWDHPVTGVESVEALPFEPRWLNVKPSRFGAVESLFETLEWAAERGVSLYGGGQFKLGVGRSHLHLLASLFYPDGPNDVVPGAYNDPVIPARLPASPLAPSAAPRGLDF